MDGRGAWRDNVFIERLWRSVKYEEVYLRAYDSVPDARASLGRYLSFLQWTAAALEPGREDAGAGLSRPSVAVDGSMTTPPAPWPGFGRATLSLYETAAPARRALSTGREAPIGTETL
jgi:hypothetical protein